MVKDFSFVGQGWCVDKSERWYSSVVSPVLPISKPDSYCLNWCSQNPHPDLVGVEVYRSSPEMRCLCDFSGQVPDVINVTDYSPAADELSDFDGVGAIELSDGTEEALCYCYDVSICPLQFFFTLFYHAHNIFLLTPLIPEELRMVLPASSLKIELSTGQNIHMFEVRVISSGTNVALGKPSSQSSTLNAFGSQLAVDGKNNTFSHTNVAAGGSPVWWKVDLGNKFAIESVLVLNRWCVSPADPNGCLCRLSQASLFLMDSNSEVVASQSVGSTCGEKEISFKMFS
jgi:hypothetical protein